ncbi:MAG: hypothetical protein ACYDFT_06975 [Thermoplasmata archaeon]
MHARSPPAGSTEDSPFPPVATMRIGGIPAARVEEIRAELNRWLQYSKLPFRAELSDRPAEGGTVVVVPASGRGAPPEVVLSAGAILASGGTAGLFEIVRQRLPGERSALADEQPGPSVPLWCDPI